MPDRYYLVAVDYSDGTVCAGEVGNLDAIEPWQLPVIGEGCTENHGDSIEAIAQAAADALRAVMPDETEVPPAPPAGFSGHVTPDDSAAVAGSE